MKKERKEQSFSASSFDCNDMIDGSSDDNDNGGGDGSVRVNIHDLSNIFIPKERRRKLSVEDVQLRLNSYAEQATSMEQNLVNDEDDHDDQSRGYSGDSDDKYSVAVRDDGENSTQLSVTNNNNNNNNNNSNTIITNSNIIFHINTNTVLYYCACLVGSMPGTLYLTSTHILLSSSTLLVFTMQPKKEVFHLTALYRTSLPTSRLKRHPTSSSSSSSILSSPSASISSSAIAMLSSNTLTLTFQDEGHRYVDVFISPLVIDCAKLQMIILEVKTTFHTISIDI